MSIYSLIFIVALCWISSTLGDSSEESLNSISNFDKRWICKIKYLKCLATSLLPQHKCPWDCDSPQQHSSTKKPHHHHSTTAHTNAGSSSIKTTVATTIIPSTIIPSITVPVESCNTCNIDQITFTPMSSADTETPTYVGPKIGSDGCLSLVVTCPATNMGWVFMQFNTNEGGPSSPTGTDVNANLKCENGNWVFDGLPNRVITEVNCVIALQKKLIME